MGEKTEGFDLRRCRKCAKVLGEVVAVSEGV